MFNPQMSELLKENLISEEQRNGLETTFLKSYNEETGERGMRYIPNEIQEADEQAPSNGKLDFYVENKTLFKEYVQEDPVQDSNTWSQYEVLSKRKKRKPRSDDRYQFIKQATAQHDIPATQIIRIAVMKTDPSLFAVVSRASKFFQSPELYLRELICLDDYKNLNDIRVRNYIYLLRMMTKVDTSPAFYQEVKRKLLALRPLCEYLGFFENREDDSNNESDSDESDSDENQESNEEGHEEEEKGSSQGKNENSQKQDSDSEKESKASKMRPYKMNQIKSVYERLESDKQIHDLEDQVECPKTNRYEDYKPFQEGQSDDDDYYDEENEDYDDESDGDEQAYRNYFEESQFLSNEDSYRPDLLAEEANWEHRSEWLIAQILRFREGEEDMQAWVPWLEAKLESLQDLDIPGLDASLNNKSKTQNNIFYLHQFLKKELEKKKDKSQLTEEDILLGDKYNPDLMVYIEEENLYPKVDINLKEIENNDSPIDYSYSNIRDKLCLKIQFREAHTDYFLTVFRRRQFGNEKVYEKRINTNGRFITIDRMEFQPVKGQFLFISMKTHKINSLPEDECYYATEEQINLIFPLEAKFKDPLFLKQNEDMSVLGFYGEKHFYTYQMKDVKKKKEVQVPKVTEGETVNPEEEKPTATAGGEDHQDEDNPIKEDEQVEEEEELEECTVYRVYEYDLHNFSRIRTQDLPFYKDCKQDKDELLRLFGKNKDSFHIVFRAPYEAKEVKGKATPAVNKDEYQYIIMRGKEQFTLKLTKNFHFRTEKHLKEDRDKDKFQEEFWFNGRGDKILLKYKKDDQIELVRLVLDPKSKIFKQDAFEFKSIKEQLTPTSKIKVKPDINDFIIMVRGNGTQQDFSIYLNDKFVTKATSTEDWLHFVLQDGQVQSIYEFIDVGSDQQECTQMQVIAMKYNRLVYRMWERGQVEGKNDWFVVEHEIINQFSTVNFPNAFFIYNHDQLYLKDVSQYGPKGYFYLNNYLGITERHRPLTVQCFSFWNQMCINVPIVEQSYFQTQFTLRIHSLTTLPSMQNSYQLTQTFFKHEIYAYNQNLSETLGTWASAIMNSDGLLHSDIRVSSIGGTLKIEKWERTRCIHRVLVAHYNQNKDASTRNVTKDKELNYREQSYKLIIIQKPEGVNAYSKDMMFLRNNYLEFQNQNMLESMFEYQEEEAHNPIIDIMIDTLPQNRLDLYILHENLSMKKFSASIQEGVNDGQPKFQEGPMGYDLTLVYQSKPSGKSTQLASKNIKLYNSFIANSILYTKLDVINIALVKESSTISQAVDLTAQIVENKVLVGQKIASPFDHENFEVDYSCCSSNEARLICIAKPRIEFLKVDESDGTISEINHHTRLVKRLVVTQLYNSRTIPQFANSKFLNAVVPVVNQQEGFSFVFTLNLDNPCCSSYNYDIDPIQYINQKNQNYAMLFTQSKFNYQPGILVKYFNGIEERLPIQERYLSIDRCIVSKQGTSVVISGFLGKVDIEEIGGRKKAKLTFHHGLHLYKLSKSDPASSLKLSRSFYYAFKKPKSPQKVEIRIQNSESQQFVLGHYNQDDINNYLYDFPNDEGHQVKLILDQSDDEDEKDDLSKNKKRTRKFRDLAQPTQGFDIPSPFRNGHFYQWKAFFNECHVDSSYFPSSITGVDDYVIELTMNVNGSDDVNADQEILEQDKKDYNRIDTINNNLHIHVNDDCQIIVLNRVNDTFYILYQEDLDTEYKVFKKRITMEENLGLQGAEISGSHLMVWGNSSFKIYEISSLLRPGSPSSINQTAIKEIDVSSFSHALGRLNYEYQEKIHQIQQKEITPAEREAAKKKRKDQEELEEEYSFKIMDVRLVDSCLIVNIEEDENTRYIQIYDFKKEQMVNFFEYDQVMISGCNNFAWFPLQNKVYDIKENFTTLLLWPSAMINTGSYDSMDIFNVTDDRTIMLTHGLLHLTFDYVSSLHDMESLQTIVETKKYQALSQQLFYKLPCDNSIIDRIFKAQSNDFSRSLHKSKKNQDRTQEDQSEKQSQLLKLINFFSTAVSAGFINNKQCTEYLLSFSKIPKSQDAKEELQRFNILQLLFDHEQKRNDIINEVIRFFVSSVDLPVTQQAVNKCFLELLQNADTSQPFQEYLHNIIRKTSRMEVLDKFPIRSTEQQFKIGTYPSPVMDDGFHIKFVDKVMGQTETKKDVQIQYVFLGGLLQEQGEEIMKELSDPKFLNIMTIPFIKYLVQLQWDNVKRDIKVKTLYPFYSLLGLFTLFCISFVNFADLNENGDPLDFSFGHLTGFEIFLYLVIFSLLTINLAYFIRIEVLQVKREPRSYFSSFWNMVDLISYSLCAFILFMEFIGIPSVYERPIACLGLIILWIKMFYYMRVYDSTSQLIRMILEIVKDMGNFLKVLLSGIIGFTGGLYIMQQGLDNRDSENTRFVGDNFVKAFIFTYRMTLGDFSMDALDDIESKGLMLDYYFIWGIFLFGTMFLVIILLNLLIAIMGATFERVREQIVNLNLREKVLLVSENENLFNRARLFKGTQFLIIISEKTEENSQEENQLAHINTLREQLISHVSSLESELKSTFADNNKEMKRQFLALEEAHKKSGQAVDVKTEKESFKEQIGKINELFSAQQAQISLLNQQIAASNQSDAKTQQSIQEHFEKVHNDLQKFNQTLQKHFAISV